MCNLSRRDIARTYLPLACLIGIPLAWWCLSKHCFGRALVIRSPMGDVTVAAPVIRRLAAEVARRIPEVRSARAGLFRAARGVGIKLLCRVTPGEEAEAFSRRIREAVRSSILSDVGMDVAEVRVSVVPVGPERGGTREARPGISPACP